MLGYQTEYSSATEPGLGLQYVRQWYLDSATGRFLTPDPLGFGAGTNLYGYAGGDPVNAVDPSGLLAIAVPLEPDEVVLEGGGGTPPPAGGGVGGGAPPVGGGADPQIDPNTGLDLNDPVEDAYGTLREHNFKGLFDEQRWAEMQRARRRVQPELGPAPQMEPPGNTMLRVYEDHVTGTAFGAAFAGLRGVQGSSGGPSAGKNFEVLPIVKTEFRSL